MQKNWFQHAVAYQVYPKSFSDSNGDGIGDLKGITAKLDYLKTLGVDLLWICPVCCSPMADNGYDISDYYHVDPSMGRDADLDELIAEAKKRGIALMMDMVLNHCSDQHELFRKATANPEGEEASFFYIRKGHDGQPPNNWRCWFGGSAWEPIGESGYYYLHVFTKHQPDLNWENPKLRRRIYRMLNYWLDKGVAGFRMDAITDLKKLPLDTQLSPDGQDGLAAVSRWTENIPGIGDFLSEMRDQTYGRVNAATVGEAGGVHTREDLEKYISLDHGYFSMIFDFCVSRINVGFYWHDRTSWTPEDFKAKLKASSENAGERCWMGIVLENHDQPRCIDHFLPPEGQNVYGASMLGLMQLMRRGTPFLYQGQELGMRNVHWKTIDQYNDVSSQSQFRAAREKGYTNEQAMEFIYEMSRDNARTPFQWNDELNAGFTFGTPWLPVNENYLEINAEQQLEDPASLLRWYQQLIALRKRSEWSEVLALGSERHLPELGQNVLAYVRQLKQKKLLVVCNFQNQEAEISRLSNRSKSVLSNYGVPVTEGENWKLRPFEALLIDESEEK